MLSTGGGSGSMLVNAEGNVFRDDVSSFGERKRQLEAEKQQEQEDYEDSKKNRNFVMMYRDHMPEMRWLMAKNGMAAAMLNFIMEHMDYTNALVCPYSVFMDYFGISKPTVTRYIKILYENGFIDILKTGSSNVYVVNQEVAWCNFENKKQYCKFEGKILVSRHENKDYDYRSQRDKLKQLRVRENIKE